MKILDRYICKQVLLASLSVLLVLLLILTGNSLLDIMADVIAGELPKDLIFSLLLINIINQSVILLPFSFFLGVVLALGRLYQDTEMAAITAAGIGTLQLYKILIWVVLPLLLLLAWMSLVVNAWSIQMQDKIWKDAQRRAEITSISPGKFNTYGQKNATLFFERYDENTLADKQRLLNIFMQFERNENIYLQTADQASKLVDSNGNVYMLYKDGQMQLADQGDGFSIIDYDEHAILMREKVFPASDRINIEALPFKALLNSDDVRYLAELQMRLSLPLAMVLLVLLAVPMSHIAPRKGRYSKLGYTILIYFLYMYVLNLMASWLSNGKLPAIPGVFAGHLLFACVIVLYILKQSGWLSAWKRK